MKRGALVRHYGLQEPAHDLVRLPWGGAEQYDRHGVLLEGPARTEEELLALMAVCILEGLRMIDEPYASLLRERRTAKVWAWAEGDRSWA